MGRERVMATQWRDFHRGAGLERVLAMIDRAVAEARQLMGDPISQVYYGLAFRTEYVDVLFRRTVRCLDALSELLSTPGFAAEVGPLLSQPLGEGGLTLRQCGLRLTPGGSCEADYLALEYALGQHPERVYDLLETLARDHLAPRLDRSSVAA